MLYVLTIVYGNSYQESENCCMGNHKKHFQILAMVKCNYSQEGEWTKEGDKRGIEKEARERINTPSSREERELSWYYLFILRESKSE